MGYEKTEAQRERDLMHFLVGVVLLEAVAVAILLYLVCKYL